ncbi:unnamed protein product [marine sediment metagenome]|uniref:Uncharacterized protein n=1 Tax=marine sediment metagenome TaxID=412755 RepID=X1GZY4_9ZZZZ
MQIAKPNRQRWFRAIESCGIYEQFEHKRIKRLLNPDKIGSKRHKKKRRRNPRGGL